MHGSIVQTVGNFGWGYRKLSGWAWCGHIHSITCCIRKINMFVITAPDNIAKASRPFVFLGGCTQSRLCGITKCPEWQDEIIRLLLYIDKGTLFNPCRKNSTIDAHEPTLEQVQWEFNALEQADIFSMWFCNANSDQPICMYELGRHLAIKKIDDIVLGIEPGYRRERDVRIQTHLATDCYLPIQTTIEKHAMAIAQAVNDY